MASLLESLYHVSLALLTEIFDPHSSIVKSIFDCHLSGVIMVPKLFRILNLTHLTLFQNEVSLMTSILTRWAKASIEDASGNTNTTLGM